MKNFSAVTGCALLVWMCTLQYASAASRNPESATTDRIEALEREIARHSADIQEIRRDQLNYQIEKDVLKETYQSNLSVINITVTIVLAGFTIIAGIIGGFGLNRISKLQDDSAKELKQLTALKHRYQSQLTAFKEQRDQLAKSQEKLEEVNDSQERRLRILELQEKVDSWFASNNYSRALEYVGVGLSLDPKDERLLFRKAACLGKLGQFAEALATTEFLLMLPPAALTSNVENALEFALLSGDVDKHDHLLKKYHAALLSESAKGRMLYLQALRAYVKDDRKQLVEILEQLQALQDEPTTASLRKWSFDELRTGLSKKPASPALTAVLSIAAAFGGDGVSGKLEQAIQSLKGSS